ncbi:hypothetical protein M427DRAFT_35091 [Gonapodya prolifera JEL478]|uniref:NAD(P)-binding protein n=1 Tax=Gonapodya prolifera (strain JEL478) TaxID=1344416 RepID=A0A139A5K7_GONPJ|nr:hypothetical protein M427DRAFT_35091 [Gonapodya prolifera JEL478]|eukprot:KXS12021.1 hypothetical protein M427DRAFT_35091 [Gonapodya prolifera JEL478]
MTSISADDLKRTTTKDGFETQLGVNHLGHFLLTNLLLGVIESTAKTSSVRIANISSRTSEFGEIDWDNLMREKPELQRRLSLSSPNADIIATSLHPGVVRTELTRYIVDGPIASLVYLLVLPIALTLTKTPWEWAQT